MNNETRREKRNELKNILKEHKNKPCADCLELYPSYVMDLDHIDDNKVKDIYDFITNMDKEGLIKEINKCEVVCSNCHRIRTNSRGQNCPKKYRIK